MDHELREKGYKTGIVTAPVHIPNLEIEMPGREDFDASVIANIPDGIKPKPHPHEEIINNINYQLP